jgi:hypothetical protein
MLLFKKSEPHLLPLAQEDHEGAQGELEDMSDDEYLKLKPHSRLRRLCSSNIPWIFTTLALLLYIFSTAPLRHKKDVPWSSTDIGNFLSMASIK